jgi:hypothetical protein
MAERRTWLPLYDLNKMRAFRTAIYAARNEFGFGPELDDVDVRIAPGQQVTAEDFMAFTEMVLESEGLPVKLLIPLEELRARFELSERQRDTQKSLEEAAGACGKAAAQRVLEVGVVMNDFKAQMKALVEARGQGPEADARAQAAVDVMRRCEEKKKQRTADSQRAVENAVKEGRQRDEDQEAYIARLEQKVARLEQTLSEILRRDDLSNLPLPRGDEPGTGRRNPR